MTFIVYRELTFSPRTCVCGHGSGSEGPAAGRLEDFAAFAPATVRHSSLFKRDRGGPETE